MHPRRTLALCACLLAVGGQEVDGPGRRTGVPQAEGGRVLTGQVLIGDHPADTGTVVLHRVAGDFSGEVDSVGTGPDGLFQLPLPAASGMGDEVFFATFRHQGILYFGPAITELPESGGSYVIQAYPALSAGPGTGPLLQVRNIILARPESGNGWVVADAFELRNAAPATLVAGDTGATWSHSLPPEAADLEVGRSDLPPGMAGFRDGRVRVSAPIPPGENVYVFRYTIAGDEFSIPLEAAAGSMELLVREPAGDLAVDGLAAAEGVELEGVRYRRYAGRDLAPSTVRVIAGETRMPFGPPSMVAVLLTLMLAAAGAVLAARSAKAAGSPGRSRRGRVLADIALLDEEWAAGRLAPEEYRSRRTRLLEELHP